MPPLTQAPDKRRRLRRMALGLGLLALAWSVLGGDQGLLSLLASWKEKYFLSREIEELKKKNEELAHEGEALARNPSQVEKQAREKLMLRKEGELIYRFDRD